MVRGPHYTTVFTPFPPRLCCVTNCCDQVPKQTCATTINQADTFGVFAVERRPEGDTRTWANVLLKPYVFREGDYLLCIQNYLHGVG
ncbi:hypothetical protein B0I21_104175 [Sphingobacterium paludis]|uniref:Uncharacterized protein n=1 Tax=Sphingobacterium paludis TaxID=1476465 RepID=A0A4R7CZ23_9SPHI|nr:hypothetical protein B0I21_104175 [Sphingobacterium paludis]